VPGHKKLHFGWKEGNVLVTNVGCYCLFISPNEVLENNVQNDDSPPLNVDEVGVCDLQSVLNFSLL